MPSAFVQRKWALGSPVRQWKALVASSNRAAHRQREQIERRRIPKAGRRQQRRSSSLTAMSEFEIIGPRETIEAVRAAHDRNTGSRTAEATAV